MRVRVIRKPPAPKMDGFDTRDLEVDHVYTVDEALGDYLVGSGYAKREPARHARRTTQDENNSRAVERSVVIESGVRAPEVLGGFPRGQP